MPRLFPAAPMLSIRIVFVALFAASVVVPTAAAPLMAMRATARGASVLIAFVVPRSFRARGSIRVAVLVRSLLVPLFSLFANASLSAGMGVGMMVMAVRERGSVSIAVVALAVTMAVAAAATLVVGHVVGAILYFLI